MNDQQARRAAAQARLHEHLDEALEADDIHDWFMIAINGSYNYGMDTPNSDVDSKLLVIPSMRQLVSGKRISRTHVMSDNGEAVDVKDIRDYFSNMMKQNINFVETMYAQAKIINEYFKPQFQILEDVRDAISGSNPVRTMQSIVGMARSQFRKIEKSDDCDYVKKRLYNLARIALFGFRFMRGTSYEECLVNSQVPNIRTSIANIKTPCFWMSKDDIVRVAGTTMTSLEKKTDDYIDKMSGHKDTIDELESNARKILDELAFNIITTSIERNRSGQDYQ